MTTENTMEPYGSDVQRTYAAEGDAGEQHQYYGDADYQQQQYEYSADYYPQFADGNEQPQYQYDPQSYDNGHVPGGPYSNGETGNGHGGTEGHWEQNEFDVHHQEQSGSYSPNLATTYQSAHMEQPPMPLGSSDAVFESNGNRRDSIDSLSSGVMKSPRIPAMSEATESIEKTLAPNTLDNTLPGSIHRTEPRPVDISLFRPRRALSFGFGGQLIRTTGSTLTISRCDLQGAEGYMNESLDPIGMRTFRPLLLNEPSLNDEQIGSISNDLAARGAKESVGCVEDGSLTGSTNLLWQALAMLVTSRGKRAEGLLASGPPPGTFDRMLLDLLGSSIAQDSDESQHDPLQSYLAASASEPQDAPALAQLEIYLMDGFQDAAVAHAIKHGLWVHALIISHYMSASSYRKVVSEFTARTVPQESSLYVVFQMLAGRGSDTVQQLPFSLLEHSWKRTIRSVVANRSPNDIAVLTALGDRLWSESESVSAAHLCYVVAGLGALQSEDRIMLLGGDHVSNRGGGRSGFVTPQTIMRTEAYLFARSLRMKASHSVDHAMAVREFQPFRLVFAMWLADLGYVDEAKEWVRSIQSIVGNNNDEGDDDDVVFLDQLNMFDARLNKRQVSPHIMGTQSWQPRSAGTISRPSFVTRLEQSLLVDSPSTPLLLTKANGPSQVDDLHMPHFDFVSPSSPSAVKPPKPSSPATDPAINEDQDKEWSNPFGAAKAKLPVPPRKLELTAPPTPLPPSSSSEQPMQKLKGENGLEPSKNKPQVLVSPPTVTSAASAPITQGPPPPQQQPQPATTQPKESGAKPPSDNTSAGGGGGWGFGGIRGWLVQKIVGVPPNATVAKTGDKLTAYYDEKLKRWVFPGETVDAGPSIATGPPIVALPNSNTMPPTGTGGAPPTPGNVAAPRPGGGIKNRYVIAS